jgi:hypothetical protein
MPCIFDHLGACCGIHHNGTFNGTQSLRLVVADLLNTPAGGHLHLGSFLLTAILDPIAEASILDPLLASTILNLRLAAAIQYLKKLCKLESWTMS